MCPAIGGLSDLKGKKVRILDGVMAKVMEKIGATPVTMAFGEVSQGFVDFNAAAEVPA